MATKSKPQKQHIPLIEATQMLKGAKLEQIPLALIDFSKFNYRKHFPEEPMKLFASEIAQHGIISPITVRPSGKRYELVAGERRVRAAVIINLETIPALVKELTDEQVIELQISENLQRENPHPYHEAQAIERLQQTGKSMEEIALRLGKSKGFIFSRLKLLQLIPDFQEMLLADTISIKDAMEIASLPTEGQEEFFKDSCEQWKE